MDYFQIEPGADGWSLIWVGYGQEGDGGGDKADGPTSCRIISVPSHHHQSYARGDRSRAWVGCMGFDGGAQATRPSTQPGPPSQRPYKTLTPGRAQTWSRPPSERSDDKVRSTSRSPIWSCKLASYRVVMARLSVTHTPHRAPRTARNRVSSNPIGSCRSSR